MHVTFTGLGSLRGALILLCAALVTVSVGAQSLETIPLKHRTAEELIPVLRPLLEEGGALTGQQYTLFVRASAPNVAQIRAAIAELDRRPRQLVISVRRDRAGSSSGAKDAVSGRVQAGDAGPASGRIDIATSRDRVASTDEASSSVAVLEGHSALISTGTTVPIVTAVAAGRGRGAWGGVVTEHRELASGFIVTPRIAGEYVVLDIEQRDERVRNGGIDTQGLNTQVRTRLGQWIQLGGIDESAAHSQSGVLSRRYATSNQTRGVWVKVEGDAE